MKYVHRIDCYEIRSCIYKYEVQRDMSTQLP